jgi:hypothetical protein
MPQKKRVILKGFQMSFAAPIGSKSTTDASSLIRVHEHDKASSNMGIEMGVGGKCAPTERLNFPLIFPGVRGKFFDMDSILREFIEGNGAKNAKPLVKFTLKTTFFRAEPSRLKSS